MYLRNSSRNFIATGGLFAGGRTDLDADRGSFGLPAKRFFSLLGQNVELLGNGCGHGYPLQQ